MKDYNIEKLDKNLKSFFINQELVLYYRDMIILFNNKRKILNYIEKIKDPKERLICRDSYYKSLIIVKNRKKLKLEKIIFKILIKKVKLFQKIPKIEEGGYVNFFYTWKEYYFYFLKFCIILKIDFWYKFRNGGNNEKPR